MNLFHKPQISAFPACIWPCLLGLAVGCPAFTPDGEAILASLRNRIASGRGGEDVYRDMLAHLAENPAWECGGPDASEDVLTAVIAEHCPQTTAPPDGPFRLRVAASQAVRPREAGSADARWRGDMRTRHAELEAAGAGRELRDRSLRLGNRDHALILGHFAPALAEGRVGAVLGKAAYAGGGASGMGGPLASPRAALDGLAITSRAGRLRMHAAGAWNRLRALGNRSVTLPSDAFLPDTLRRDAGLLAAGLYRPVPERLNGWGYRAQGLVLRLETGERDPAWIPVAGIATSVRSAAWRWEFAAAASRALWRAEAAAGRAEWGGFAEASLAWRGTPPAEEAPGEGAWTLRVRQASPYWSNPLAAGSGIRRDTLDGGWVVSGAGEGGLDAATALPLAAWKGGRTEIRAGGALAWVGGRNDSSGSRDWLAGEDLARGEGRIAWVQTLDAWSWSSGAGLGWRRTGLGGATPGGWGHSLEWRHAGWRARADWTRMAEDYTGSRPEPVGLACGWNDDKGAQGMSWRLEWSTADGSHPWRAQRLEGRQSWPGGKGVRVEQRLQLPFASDDLAAGLDYQLGLRAEF